ncbi:unnamed protein product [Cuscuta campestris]|uniref:RNase H type-1 domain-containing protein n=1 Tax=Cuscuta campestris TaxID=132261 RepID=A0A484L0G3_9ASTE|nr:unnamed protein product [Cuscuta campestris]
MATAVDLGSELVRQKIRLTYGGGNVGLQGVVASTVYTNGGIVRGFIPGYIAARQVYGPMYGAEYTVSSNYYKHFEMNHVVEAFIVLPGGIDTMEGLFTLISWASEGCEYGMSKALAIKRDKGKVYQFLMGLDNEGYGSIRSIIISIEPLAPLSRVYSTIILQEGILEITEEEERNLAASESTPAIPLMMSSMETTFAPITTVGSIGMIPIMSTPTPTPTTTMFPGSITTPGGAFTPHPSAWAQFAADPANAQPLQGYQQVDEAEQEAARRRKGKAIAKPSKTRDSAFKRLGDKEHGPRKYAKLRLGPEMGRTSAMERHSGSHHAQSRRSRESETIHQDEEEAESQPRASAYTRLSYDEDDLDKIGSVARKLRALEEKVEEKAGAKKHTLAKFPFSTRVHAQRLRRKIKLDVEKFTGKEDPNVHLDTFHNAAQMAGCTDAEECLLFFSSLRGRPVEWPWTEKWCTYHQSDSHNTVDCRNVKAVLKEMALKGELGEGYATGNKKDPKANTWTRHQGKDQGRRKSGKDNNNPDKEFIEMIVGGPEGRDTASQRKSWARSLHVAVVSLEPQGKQARREPITFTDRDLPRTGEDHNDPLVITMDINGAELDRSMLRPLQTPLSGFTGASIEAEGQITLPVTLGSGNRTVTKQMRFVVVDIKCVHNAILGRPGINQVRAIISMAHLCMKFYTPNGIGEERGDQKNARSCYLEAVKKMTCQFDQIELVSKQVDKGEEKARIEPDANMEEIQIDASNPERKVKIGADLQEELRTEIVQVLTRYKSLFAWSVADMPGIDRSVICHRLSVLEGSRAVRQKKRFLANLDGLGCYTLYLYLGVTQMAVSSVLMRDDGVQRPIYYVSKALNGAESRYTPTEKAGYALFITAKELTSYFQAHPIVVLSDLPLGTVMRDSTSSGRMIKWAMMLTQFNIEYRPRTAIKGQVVAEFLVEMTGHQEEEPARAITEPWWSMSVDGASRPKGYGGGVVFTTPEGFKLYHALIFNFKLTNNEAEYEALIGGLRLAKTLQITCLRIKSDSSLVVGHINGNMEAKGEKMQKYRGLAKALLKDLVEYVMEQIPRGENTDADLLSKLTQAAPEHVSKLARIEMLEKASIEGLSVSLIEEDGQPNLGLVLPDDIWMDDLVKYYMTGKFPEDEERLFGILDIARHKDIDNLDEVVDPYALVHAVHERAVETIREAGYGQMLSHPVQALAYEPVVMPRRPDRRRDTPMRGRPPRRQRQERQSDEEIEDDDLDTYISDHTPHVPQASPSLYTPAILQPPFGDVASFSHAPPPRVPSDTLFEDYFRN